MCVSKPKIPAPTPVIERQAYKNAPSRASLASDDNETRRRAIAGILTSAQGVGEQSSTTKRVRAGGDQNINPIIGGGGGSVTPAAPISGSGITTAPGPTQGAQPKSSVKKKGGFVSLPGGLLFPLASV